MGMKSMEGMEVDRIQHAEDSKEQWQNFVITAIKIEIPHEKCNDRFIHSKQLKKSYTCI